MTDREASATIIARFAGSTSTWTPERKDFAMTAWARLRRILGSPATIGVVAYMAASPTLALTQDEISNLSGADREKILIDGAKKEARMLWYTSMIVNQAVRPIIAGFEKKYPFVKADFFRAESSDILQRLLAEYRARALKVDVVSTTIANVVRRAGLTQPFHSPVLADYPESYIDPGRNFVVLRTNYQGIAWNTNLVRKEDAPHSWEDLLDPKWKDKMAWSTAPSTGAPSIITYFRMTWGENKALDYLQRLKRQNVRSLGGSVRAALDQVIAGEFSIGISMQMHHIAISKSAGAPIDGYNPAPMAYPAHTYIVKGAPHPYMAMLFTDFLLTREEGQTILRDAQYYPANRAVEPLPLTRWTVPRLNGQTETLADSIKMEEMLPRSIELYDELFR
jgi:ABC-type Fe3+ transport system substrate-binding protein